MPRRRVVRGDDPHVIDVLAPPTTQPTPDVADEQSGIEPDMEPGQALADPVELIEPGDTLDLHDPAMLDPPADPLVDPPPAPTPPFRPVPEHQLTPEQRRIRELEDRLAQELGRRDAEPEPDPAITPGAKGNIVIHFLEDGLTALGSVWYRGQELEFARDSPAYRDTCDRNGRSWLDLREDESAQVQRWGKVMFRPGPWPGKALTAAATTAWEALKPLREGQKLTPTESELAAVAGKEAARGRVAPRLPMR